MSKHIILLIDNSWSMGKYNNKIRLGLSKLIVSLKSSITHIEKTFLTVAFFNDTITYKIKAQDVSQLTVNYFDNPMFIYDGYTSLYDCINSILQEWKEKIFDENILYIVSDGDDNNSNISKKEGEVLVSNFEKTGKWKIVYCNTDMSKMNVKYNITYKIDKIDDLLGQLNMLKI